MTTFTENFDNFTADIRALKERDKYGRTVRKFQKNVPGEHFNTRVVVVNLPKGAWEHHGGAKYLVNDWQHPSWIDGVSQGEAEGKLTYVYSLKEARGIVAAKIHNPHPLSTR